MIYLVISSPTLWLLGINYFFNSMMRSGITATFRPFLEGKANSNGGLDFTSDSGAAETANVSYEIGGAIGALLAGYLSDQYFNGRRGPVMGIFGFITIPFLILLANSSTFILSTNNNDNKLFQSIDSVILFIASFTSTSLSLSYIKISLLYFILGVCTFPPHVLNGLISRELAHPLVLSTAGGFTKAIGQLGSALMEMYVLRLADIYQWSTIFYCLSISSCLSSFFIIPLWNTVPVSKTNTNTNTNNSSSSSNEESIPKK